MAGFGNAKKLMVDIDFDVSGMKSMSKLSEAIQNGTKDLEGLEQQLKEATEAQENLAKGAGFATSQLKAQARAIGKLDALDAAGRGQTAQTEKMSARASDIQNITAETDRLRESQQKIQEFEDILGEQGLAMDKDGNIKDGNRRLENRGEILQQVMQGQEKMQLRDKIDSVPQVNEQLQNAREASLGANQGLSRYSSQLDEAGNKVMSFMGRTEAMSTTLQQNQVPEFMGEMAGQTADRQGFRRQMPEPQVGNLGGTLLAMEGLSQNAQAVNSSTGSAAESLRSHMDVANNMQTPAQNTSTMFGKISTNADKASDSYNSVNKSVDNANRQFGKNFGIGMNLMFMGMALQQVFGSLSKKMLKMTGASAAFGAAMKSVLLPFFMAITPLVTKLATAMIKLPRPIKMTIGALVAFASILGVVLFFGSQLALLAISLQVSFASMLIVLGGLVLSFTAMVFAIVMLRRAFKKFGPIVGLITTILVASLTVFGAVASAVLGIFGAFMAVNQVFKKFGKIAGTIATLIVGVIAVIVGAFVSVPVAIGLAIGAAIAFLWNFRDEIASALNLIKKGIVAWIDFVVNQFKKFTKDPIKHIQKLIAKAQMIGFKIKQKVRKGLKAAIRAVAKEFKLMKARALAKVKLILDFFSNLGQKIADKASDIASDVQSIGSDIIDGIVNGIQNNVDAITDAFKENLPDWAMKGLKAAGGAIEDGTSAVGNAMNVNDFIMTDSGQVIQPSPNDTIVGFNGNGPIQPGAGGGGETTVNINDPVMKEEADIERLVDEVEDRVNRDTRGRSGGI